MPQQWKDFQITAGSLVAFLMGLLAMGATFSGVQSWVDDRIADRVSPLKSRVTMLEGAHEFDQERYSEVRRLLNDILEQLPEQEDAEK